MFLTYILLEGSNLHVVLTPINGLPQRNNIVVKNHINKAPSHSIRFLYEYES